MSFDFSCCLLTAANLSTAGFGTDGWLRNVIQFLNLRHRSSHTHKTPLRKMQTSKRRDVESRAHANTRTPYCPSGTFFLRRTVGLMLLWRHPQGVLDVRIRNADRRVVQLGNRRWNDVFTSSQRKCRQTERRRLVPSFVFGNRPAGTVIYSRPGGKQNIWGATMEPRGAKTRNLRRRRVYASSRRPKHPRLAVVRHRLWDFIQNFWMRDFNVEEWLR